MSYFEAARKVKKIEEMEKELDEIKKAADRLEKMIRDEESG